MQGGIKMAWIYLIIAGLLEIVWAIALKYSHGFTEVTPTIITIVTIVISFYFFSNALKKIAVGTAYAVFTGIGAAGTAILGMTVLDEGTNIGKILFLGLMIFGIVGLKLISTEETEREES